MNRRHFASLLAALVSGCALTKNESHPWRVGVARRVITPIEPLWLAGYGSRDRPAESKLHDLWLKVLALADPRGHMAVFVAADHLGWPRGMMDKILNEVSSRTGLDRSQIMLTASHTHSGPVLRDSLLDYYPLGEKELAAIERYSSRLEEITIAGIEQALTNLQPAELFAGEGSATFAVNRRNNSEAEVPAMRERGEPLKGPVDHSVPVLAVKTPEGRLGAVIFGYACHSTTLADYAWCGDYPGFAQTEIETQHPGTTAMFFAGCGADQNPIPRRSAELCRNYGHQLAAAVNQALATPLRSLDPKLSTAIDIIDLPFERNPTREELIAVRQAGAIRGRWAERMIARLDRGEEFPTSYPYTTQAWRLGDQLWLSLAGEVVVDYSLRFKREFGEQTWITAFAHDLVAYIPSRRIWDEGGYEGGALYEYMLPAERWSPDIEDRIAASVRSLVKKASR
jgi:neutral ceramidase